MPEALYLDCHDLDSALRSFAIVGDRPESALAEAIASYDVDWDTATEETESSVPQEVFGQLELSEETFTFAGTCFFHGTRSMDPARFQREGILPLGHIVDQIWSDLHQLIFAEISPAAWLDHRRAVEAGAGGHSGWLYRLKTQDAAFHGGPYAYLIRDQHLSTFDGHHDYLAIPEIVQDIARTCDFGLQDLFESAASPHIVKFRTAETTTHAIHTAFWYIHASLRGEKLGWHHIYGHDCRNVAVPPGDVLEVTPVPQ
jgi:hypothetical protein